MQAAKYNYNQDKPKSCKDIPNAAYCTILLIIVAQVNWQSKWKPMQRKRNFNGNAMHHPEMDDLQDDTLVK